MDKQNVQMNAPHPGTNLTGGYPLEYPSAAFPGPPGYIGCPGPQAGYPVPPAGYASPGPAGFPVQHQPAARHPGEPTQVSWMPPPLPPANCPPGLEYLTQIDQLLIHQQMELLEGYELSPWHRATTLKAADQSATPDFLECRCCSYEWGLIPAVVSFGPELLRGKGNLRKPVDVSGLLPGKENLDKQAEEVEINLLTKHLVLTGFETRNRYEIKNSLGQRVYFASEDTDCCTRNCWGPARPFAMRILDNLGREVMTLERPLRCACCCCPCCLQEIEIQAPPGVPVGYVTQIWHPCLPKFTVQNERREDVLRISGPCVACSCCADVHFEVKSLDDKYVVGKISKHWTGLVRELFTDADNFGIQFPLDLDVKMKAVMLGACFLIDFMFFETIK